VRALYIFRLTCLWRICDENNSVNLKEKETMMKTMKISVLALSLLTFAGNAGAVDWTAICCDGGYEYRHPNAWEKEQQRLKDELAAAQKLLAERDREIASLRSGAGESLRSAQAELDRSKTHIAELERQLADRDRELASLRSGAGDSSRLASQLSSAQGDLDQAKARVAELERQLAAAQAASADKDRLTSELAAAQSQLAALQAGAGDKDKLAADLAAAQSQLAALQAGAGDRDKLAVELAAAKQRIADLEAQLAAMGGAAGDKEKLAAELAAANRRVADLEGQLADRNKELAGLHGELSAEMAKLKEAQRGLIKALHPQIEKGTIKVDLNNERLLINLASSYLFGSGEDQLKPAGADALKQVGAILKDFPEYKVAVDGHTDNRPIRSSLKKKFPTNKELSEARATNAANALAEGGLSGASTTGYADTRPVAPNTADAGRAQNRRVEVRVTR
jgi:chemotaxis protein MotB